MTTGVLCDKLLLIVGVYPLTTVTQKAWAYNKDSRAAAQKFRQWQRIKLYEERLERGRKLTRESLQRRRDRLSRYKVKQRCSICGYNTHPEALDWDHTNPLTKLFSIGSSSSRPLKTLFKELRKCTILCANCHRVKTCDDRKRLTNGKKCDNLL